MYNCHVLKYALSQNPTRDGHVHVISQNHTTSLNNSKQPIPTKYSNLSNNIYMKQTIVKTYRRSVKAARV